MHPIPSLGALACCALVTGVSIPAQSQQASEETQLRLRFREFDPLAGEPAMSEVLRSGGTERLFVVQFEGIPTQSGRDALTAAGVEIHGYLPDDAYVVRMDPGLVASVGGQAAVRWVGRYHAAYRLQPELVAGLASGRLQRDRYNMVVVDKHNDKPALAAAIRGIGGVIDNEHPGSLLFTATLTPDQLVQTAHLDQVLWIDQWTPIEEDVNNARAQGGANYVESQGGYTGNGLNVHIYEGVHQHIAFSGGVQNVLSGGQTSSHGTSTAGIVFGDGTGNASFRGFAPDTGKYYTNYSSVSASRWQVVNTLVNTYNVSHTTASWGNTRTTQYTSISADADDIIFDHDIPWTQSQSNAGNQDSRPQAWAKNIFSIGGFRHNNNASPGDDSWQGGNGSTGPAADGRLKPTLAAYYESIGTTSGSSSYTTTFGGTSGATPIVAGHNILAIDMFTDDSGTPGVGKFLNPLRNPGGSKHSNRPHFTTLKALQCANSYKYTPTVNDNRREHVGWGYPGLQTMWDDRLKTFIIDETDILTQGQVSAWSINVPPSEDAFKAVLNYSEPAANPGANPTLINNLSMRVTSPGGTVYWGNNGLNNGNWSVVGGSEDNINPIECVFVQNPQAGTWNVEIIATAIVQDNHVETPGVVDADYALVVTGGTGQPSTAAFFTKYGQGCPGSPFTVMPCAELNPNGGTLTGVTAPFEHGILVAVNSMQLESFSIYTRSTGGTQVVPAAVYQLLQTTPLATSTMTIGPNADFYTATFNPPVNVTSGIFIAIDISAQTVVVPQLTGGAAGSTWTRSGGGWSFPSGTSYPAYSVACTAGTVYDVPELGNNGLPVLGTTYDVTLSDAVGSSAAFLLTGLSDSIFSGTPLPAPLPNAPGCQIFAAPAATSLVITSGGGTATGSIGVPISMSYIGLQLYHQWAVLDAANALGIVVSDAGKARVGT